MTLLLDTSALVKLLVAEDETGPLRQHLQAQPDRRVAACSLVRTELRRAVLRRDPGLLPAADDLLARLALVRLDDALLDRAGRLPPPGLRSLDALHLATALLLPGTELVTYDDRMLQAAAAAGVAAAAPGR